MNVLQLCTYYIGNKLHSKLFSNLNEESLQQTIYVPIRNKGLNNRNLIKGEGLELHYDLILKRYDRYLYKGKINKQMKRIETIVSSLQEFDLVHAHTLFSDGGTAYLLKKKYGINYIVSVRNTDINTFYKYALHQRPFIHKVLQNASAVVFISHVYKQKTLQLLPDNLVNSIEEKSYVIPNGIDNQWLEINKRSKKISGPQINLVFAGSLDKNKNLHTVLRVMKESLKTNEKFFLNVAGDGPLKDKLIDFTNRSGFKNKVHFHGHVSLKNLIKLMDESDIFILPSYKETFGISYIEAMARGLPIIYTRDEGVDGYFKEGYVGFSTNPNSVDEIKKNINKIIENYEQMSMNAISESKKFNWKEISNIYLRLYRKIINEL
ncbi:glycosyltransferase family 4 protein [Siminovitchia fordii]|uniref:Glycosyl transferase n=1 Tax=Siminovitchia fordii TaxID=254759 RepID=A0ABQ4KBS0_9BACI|nr:glycosyltransferase family 4 protein [Siminovitchia fordii]GIN23157.1 glycosyl transferase [Siminovitchia fordii]